MELFFIVGQNPSVASSRFSDSEACSANVGNGYSAFSTCLSHATKPDSRGTAGGGRFKFEYRCLRPFPLIYGLLAFVFQSLNLLQDAVTMAVVLLWVSPIQIVEPVVCSVIVPMPHLSIKGGVRVRKESQSNKPMEWNVFHFALIR